MRVFAQTLFLVQVAVVLIGHAIGRQPIEAGDVFFLVGFGIVWLSAEIRANRPVSITFAAPKAEERG